jgi:hypothetical protein
MQSRQNGEFRRSVMSALAAMLAAAVPSLVSSPALAEKPADKAPEAASDNGASKAKPAVKHVKKAHVAKKTAQKTEGAAKQETPKPAEAKASKEAKTTAAATKGKKVKKTAARAASGAKPKKTAKKADTDAPGRRCTGTPLTIDRGGLEVQSLPVVDCHGKPLDSAQTALSVLARPWGAAKPAHLPPHATAAAPAKPRTGPAKGDEVAPGVRMIDKGLLVRLDAIARHFQGRPLSLVSGYRPQSRGSLHRSGHALDVRVAGVSNEQLVEFCKTLPDTGCGYYPNSSFVHVDVRPPRTGHVEWIDTSGPGEAPHYVHQWPPPPEQADKAVLPPDGETHDDDDPWADPGDEHAPTSPKAP